MPDLEGTILLAAENMSVDQPIAELHCQQLLISQTFLERKSQNKKINDLQPCKK